MATSVHEPPKIEVAGLDPSDGGPTTDSDHFDVNATVTDNRPLRDVYVFVNEQKVFFHAIAKGETSLQFEHSLPLKPGNNAVTFPRSFGTLASLRAIGGFHTPHTPRGIFEQGNRQWVQSRWRDRAPTDRPAMAETWTDRERGYPARKTSWTSGRGYTRAGSLPARARPGTNRLWSRERHEQSGPSSPP